MRWLNFLLEMHAQTTTTVSIYYPHKLSTYGANPCRESQDICLVCCDVLGHKDVKYYTKHYAGCKKKTSVLEAFVKLRKD